MSIDRRQLLKRSGAAGLGIAFAGSVETLFAGPAGAAAQAPGEAIGYGPLQSDPAGILDLPEGFRYRILSRTGDSTSVAGQRVPGRPDGMATFPVGNRTRLVRNHEQGNSGDPAVRVDPKFVYDPGAIGGTTTLTVNKNLDVVDEYVSLYGSATNCAGGRTPWQTWLTCEETESKAGSSGYTKDHGYVFEVDPHKPKNNENPTPIKQLGRFPHEAAVVDPNNGTVYLTEDASNPFGLLYRFVPSSPYANRYGGLRTSRGKLQAMRSASVRDLSTVQTAGTVLNDITWAEIPDPDARTVSTRKQLTDDKVTRSQKLEGAWWNGDSFYFVCSYSRTDDATHDIHEGQVWSYHPGRNRLRLELIFKPGTTRFDSPDNITVSPYGGGVVIAEDGEGQQHLIGVTSQRRPFPIARNALNNTPDPADPSAPEPPASFSEFCGVTFSDDSQVLFFNMQEPGITFALTGPWYRLDERRNRQAPTESV